MVRNARRTGASRAAREEFAREERASPPPEEILQEAEAQRLLAESVTKLPEPLRVVIVLHHFRGLDSNSIARELGLSASTVRTRLQKALAELRAELDRRVEGGRRAWSLALGAIARGARTGGSAGAATVTGSAAATLVAPPSVPALPWVAGALLLISAGLAAWRLASERRTPALEAAGADRVAASAPGAETALELAAGGAVAERVPIASHGHERAALKEKSLHFNGEILVDGRAPEDQLFLAVDGWEESLGKEGSEEEHHMVRSTREFLVRGVGYFDLGPLPLDWSGSLRVRDHVFENGQESMPLAGPSRELVLRLQGANAISGRLVDPLGHFVGDLSYELWVEASDGGAPVSGVARRGRCDAEGRFRIPVARHGTSQGALLFDVPGLWRRLVTIPPFRNERGIELGDVMLEPAAAQRFRLFDSFGAPLGFGGAVLVAPGDLGRVSSTGFEGFGVLPSLEQSGAEVRFFAPRHEEKVMRLHPCDLAEVQLERTSSLDVRFASTGGPPGILRVVVTAEQEIFAPAALAGVGAVVRTGSDWCVRKTSPPGGRAPALELHYTVEPWRSLALDDLRPGVPFQIEVKDDGGRSLAVRSTYVVQGEWQGLEIPVELGPERTMEPFPMRR